MPRAFKSFTTLTASSKFSPAIYFFAKMCTTCFGNNLTNDTITELIGFTESPKIVGNKITVCVYINQERIFLRI